MSMFLFPAIGIFFPVSTFLSFFSSPMLPFSSGSVSDRVSQSLWDFFWVSSEREIELVLSREGQAKNTRVPASRETLYQPTKACLARNSSSSGNMCCKKMCKNSYNIDKILKTIV